MSIEFLFSDWDPQTGAPQLEEEELRSMEAILRVAESDISGFTGHNGKCCLLDETTSEMVDIKLNLSWDLKVESIQEQLQWGNIVAAHFSSGLLATGAYYWKFYGSLFGALLLDPSTETEALKCLNEIAFILGSSHKQGLAKHLMVLLQKRIIAFEDNPVGCCADECDNQARLLHGVLLVLESLPVDDQGEMMLKLGDPTFAHLLRLRCLAVSSSRLVHLHQVALRKLMLIAKKNKSRSGRQVEPLLGYLSKLLIDTVKQGDQTFTSKEEAAQLQDDAIWILAKLSKATKEDGDRTVTGSCTTSSTESSGDEESSYSDEDSAEEDAEEAQESEYSTSESLDTQLSSPKTTTTSTPSLAAFNVALGNFQAKRGPHWEHFAKVPPTVVERLLGEDTLEDGVYYEQMKTLLKKVARQIKEADSE